MTNNLGGASHSLRAGCRSGQEAVHAGGQTQAKHLIFSVRGGQRTARPTSLAQLYVNSIIPEIIEIILTAKTPRQAKVRGAFGARTREEMKS
jgi:hypothetical protein